ncbi:MAG: hypothetical protein ACKV19_16385 [Verrucomicrobiales bacterium]
MTACPTIIHRLLPAMLAGALGCGPVARGQDASFDAAEARTALKAALAQNQELQDRLAAEKSANNAMAVKVGILSAEASAAREELEEIKRRAEAAGPVHDPRGLEQRILDAVNDLRLTKESKDETDQRLHQLADAIQAYLAADAESAPALRTSVEQALAAATAPTATDDPEPSPTRIESSRVVSVKPDQRLLIVNAGRLAGMKPGTPLRIFRNDRPLASAVVVEVRASLSGSLITQLEGDEFPRVGDTLRVIAETQ